MAKEVACAGLRSEVTEVRKALHGRFGRALLLITRSTCRLSHVLYDRSTIGMPDATVTDRAALVGSGVAQTNGGQEASHNGRDTSTEDRFVNKG